VQIINFVKKHISIFIILIFHIVGFVGFLINPSYFKSLSTLNLLLSTGLVLIMSQQTHWKFYGSLLLIAFIGFFLEVLGVKTELIFGSYHYGRALGFKALSVPLLIGVNWAILLYCTAQFSRIKHHLLNALFGAFLMVFLDFFIEQHAARFDFWYWKNDVIPLQNYIAWFIISFILNLVFQKRLGQKSNLTARAFYVIEIIFFAALYLFN
jgi:putative membrane protein